MYNGIYFSQKFKDEFWFILSCDFTDMYYIFFLNISYM